MFKKSIILALLLAFLTLSIGLGLGTNASHAFASSSVVAQKGDTSGDVWDIQYRLKVLRDYNHPIDGIYGVQTQYAVRKFQSDFGLTIDGIVGKQTISKLKHVSVNMDELDMMAHMIYAEARGESYIGQVAVGAVIMNRLKSAHFPNTIKGIIFQPGAFSSIDDGQYWLKPDSTAYRAALDAAAGWDPAYGALYYFNPETANSRWIWGRHELTKIGHHIFAV